MAWLGFYIVTTLLAGVQIEVSDQWLPALALFLLICFAYSLLEEWLVVIDRISVQPMEEVSTRFKIVGSLFLLLLPIVSMIGAAIVFDNLVAIYRLVYGTMGLTLMCAMLYVALASPLIPVWIVRQWLKVIRDLREIKKQGRIERP